MKHDEVIGIVGSGISTILTVSQTNDIFQLVQLIISIISGLLTVLYICWKWYKKASQDGKITPDEIDDLFTNLKNNIKEEDKDE